MIIKFPNLSQVENRSDVRFIRGSHFEESLTEAEKDQVLVLTDIISRMISEHEEEIHIQSHHDPSKIVSCFIH